MTQQIIINLIAIYLGLCLFALLFAKRMIFPAPQASYQNDEGIIRLPLRSGKEISALYLPNPEATHTILYSHGNAEDLGTIRPTLLELHRLGFAVMAYDYPGYGTSDGTPSETGSYEAAAATYTYLVTLLNTNPDQIILFGRSLGSGPSFELAGRKPVAGLILDGAFASTFRVMTRIKLLPWDIFDNLSKAPRVSCPTLIMHGKQDRTVPFSHALALQSALTSAEVSTLFLDDAGHNNLIETAGPRYWQSILDLTAKLKPARPVLS
jgi:fermentation-respiration switch protein FrsA (DUF1100 family)